MLLYWNYVEQYKICLDEFYEKSDEANVCY